MGSASLGFLCGEAVAGIGRSYWSRRSMLLVIMQGLGVFGLSRLQFIWWDDDLFLVHHLYELAFDKRAVSQPDLSFACHRGPP